MNEVVSIDEKSVLDGGSPQAVASFLFKIDRRSEYAPVAALILHAACTIAVDRRNNRGKRISVEGIQSCFSIASMIEAAHDQSLGRRTKRIISAAIEAASMAQVGNSNSDCHPTWQAAVAAIYAKAPIGEDVKVVVLRNEVMAPPQTVHRESLAAS